MKSQNSNPETAYKRWCIKLSLRFHNPETENENRFHCAKIHILSFMREL